MPSLSDVLLDISRLLLLDLFLLLGLTLLVQGGRLLHGGRPGWILGLQERFLAGYLALGLMLLLLAGIFAPAPRSP